MPACPRSSLADVVLCGRVVSPQEVHVCLPDLCKSRYNAGDLEQAIAPVVKKAAHRPPGEADPQFRPFRGQPRLCCACAWRLAPESMAARACRGQPCATEPGGVEQKDLRVRGVLGSSLTQWRWMRPDDELRAFALPPGPAQPPLPINPNAHEDEERHSMEVKKFSSKK